MKEPELYLCGANRKPEESKDNWKFADEKRFAMAEADLPTAYSIKEAFPPVYMQVYGSCTAYASLGADGYYKKNKAFKPSGDYTYYNERLMLGVGDMSQNCGASVEIALKAIKKYGVCDAKVWPNGQPLDKKPSKEAYINGPLGHEISKYYLVKKPVEIKRAIAKGYPVVLSMSWPFKTAEIKNGKLKDVTRKEADECLSGHAVVIVGYDDEKRVFELRNSWGEAWGNHGYIFIGYGTLLKCIWFNDTYAIVR